VSEALDPRIGPWTDITEAQDVSLDLIPIGGAATFKSAAGRFYMSRIFESPEAFQAALAEESE
jgi:hypothetical protein